MRQRSLAASTKSRNVMLLGKVESQYLVGSFSPSGHSISNHSLDGAPSAVPQSEGEVLDRDRIGRVTLTLLRCAARPLARLPHQHLRLNAGHIALSKLSDTRAQL